MYIFLGSAVKTAKIVKDPFQVHGKLFLHIVWPMRDMIPSPCENLDGGLCEPLFFLHK